MNQSDPISPESRTQSQFSPGLYIAATPIGNLRDITLRVLDALHAADRILAEDTRQTRKLLDAYNINTPLSAYHDHNVAKMVPNILNWLDSGEIIVQVSDAGTPLISDPGYKLVVAVIEAGHDVTPLPGASAPMAALMAAGLPTDRFTFIGFLPSKTAARRSALFSLMAIKSTLVFFESPNRIAETLSDIQAVLGDRRGVIAREISKKYEEFRRGKITELIESVDDDPPRGEIVLLVSGPNEPELWTPEEVDRALREKLPELGAKRASAEIADQSGWAKRNVYQRAILLS